MQLQTYSLWLITKNSSRSTYTVNFFPSQFNIRPGANLRGFFNNIDITESIGSIHSRRPADHRPYRRADLRSRCTAFEPPELAQLGDHAAGPSSRTPSLGKLARRPGESGRAHSQQDAKLAEVAPTAARIDRNWSASSARGHGAEIFPFRYSLFLLVCHTMPRVRGIGRS